MSATVNYPRFSVTMNGTQVPGVESVTITEPIAFVVGTFHFKKVFTANDPFPPSWWCATANKTMLVEIDLSVDGQAFTQKITGNVDSHSYDPIENCISVAGRDLAAIMLDTRTLNTYRNQTSSQVAQTIAKSHGLSAIVTNTSTIVGRYYSTDHDHISGDHFVTDTNEWDLLCRLAAKEGILPYMLGNTLYFQAAPSSPPLFTASFSRDANGYPVSNVDGLTLTRHLTQARDVRVTVRSWHSRSKKRFTATYRTKTKTPGTDPNQPPTNYLFVHPNLTQAQCQAQAQQIALEISQHERNVSASIPSLQLLGPTYELQVSGTGTDYDQTYAIRKITYEIDTEHGAKTSVEAKFSSPVDLYDETTGAVVGEQA